MTSLCMRRVLLLSGRGQIVPVNAIVAGIETAAVSRPRRVAGLMIFRIARHERHKNPRVATGDPFLFRFLTNPICYLLHKSAFITKQANCALFSATKKLTRYRLGQRVTFEG